MNAHNKFLFLCLDKILINIVFIEMNIFMLSRVFLILRVRFACLFTFFNCFRLTRRSSGVVRAERSKPRGWKRNISLWTFNYASFMSWNRVFGAADGVTVWKLGASLWSHVSTARLSALRHRLRSTCLATPVIRVSRVSVLSLFFKRNPPNRPTLSVNDINSMQNNSFLCLFAFCNFQRRGRSELGVYRVSG